jgi:hypothetical protein
MLANRAIEAIQRYTVKLKLEVWNEGSDRQDMQDVLKLYREKLLI